MGLADINLASQKLFPYELGTKPHLKVPLSVYLQLYNTEVY